MGSHPHLSSSPRNGEEMDFVGARHASPKKKVGAQHAVPACPPGEVEL